MRVRTGLFKLVLVAMFAGLTAPQCAAAPASSKPPKAKKISTRRMNEEQRAEHALNRLTFGPRPGDVQRVLAVGVDKWIEQQLAPEKIDDRALDTRLAPLRSLHMSTADLIATFPPQQVIRAVADGKQPMPTDPARKVIYEVELAEFKQQQAAAEKRKAEEKKKEEQGGVAFDPEPDPAALAAANDEAARRVAALLVALPPDKRATGLAEMSPEDLAKLRYLRGDERERVATILRPEEREMLEAIANPGGIAVNELTQGKMLRAIYSERQLQEVMTDFWFNHFNIYIYKDDNRYLTTSFERDVIRPHVLGKFGDLLRAVAESPAMLTYLDNFASVGPDSPAAKQALQRQARNPQAAVPGLNENYARELMELHTLGVDGGYTQQDVREVARVFTGWGIDRPDQVPRFGFHLQRHDPGDKLVLGHTIKQMVTAENGVSAAVPAGQQEGLEVLEMLATSPATAHFVSRKLAVRFVDDNPPATLVDAMADTFLKTDGDIREVLRTMFRSREFWSQSEYRAKVKTPLEFVASAVRATGADVQTTQPLIGFLNRMGMQLYGQQAPTGYKTTADAWLNSNTLVDRLNFAMQLANGRINGVHADGARVVTESLFASDKRELQALKKAPKGSDVTLALAEAGLVPGGLSRPSQAAIQLEMKDPKYAAEGSDPSRPLNLLTALVLGSPEFQKK